MWSWVLLAAASAACEGEPVEIGGKTYAYSEEGGCGNGRHATCSTTHRLQAGPDCTGPALEELFGGGSSRRAMELTGASPAERDWVMKKVGVHVREAGAVDLLASKGPEFTAVPDTQRAVARPDRWVAGEPQAPRQSWASAPCDTLEEEEPTPGRECFDVFRGDQVKFVQKLAISDTVSLYLFANEWRNRRIFHVLHDATGNRHAFLGEVVTMGALPELVGRFQGGAILFRPMFMDHGLVFDRIQSDGTIERATIEGRSLEKKGDALVLVDGEDEVGEVSWPALFGTPAPLGR